MTTHSHPVLRQQLTAERESVSSPVEPSYGLAARSGRLEEVRRASEGSENLFPCRAILFVGAECYDAPTVTILQGLDELGFAVYTIGKPNVNSWFCNRVMDGIGALELDFVLSNVQWGVRWSHYSRFGLHGRLKVLIDGCDNHGDLTWRQKIERVRARWRIPPPEDVMARNLQPYEWGELEDAYEPDVLFASQKFACYDAIYLPFGIQREFLSFRQGKTTSQRALDFAHVTGQGSARTRLEEWFHHFPPPGRVFNGPAKGTPVVDDRIEHLVRDDGENGIHSYFRWVHYRGYFELLNDTKVLVCPNVWMGLHWWDSKRPWEAYASECLVMLERPSIDMSEYPATDLCPFAIYDSEAELSDKCRYLHDHQNELESIRSESAEAALKYFTPVPLARRFLARIAEAR